jgi:hypothetical protein
MQKSKLRTEEQVQCHHLKGIEEFNSVPSFLVLIVSVRRRLPMGVKNTSQYLRPISSQGAAVNDAPAFFKRRAIPRSVKRRNER